MTDYRVVAPLVQARTPAEILILRRGSTLPATIDADIIDHLSAMGMVAEVTEEQAEAKPVTPQKRGRPPKSAAKEQ